MRGAPRDRSPFELLRFSATPVPGALVVVEMEGRVAAASGRFSRRPVLVVEPSGDRRRLELEPARSTLDGDRWQAAYAIPAEAYDAARFALGLRGTLLDLPAPDEPTALDRQTLLAREANALRRQLEAAETAAEAARAEAIASAGELGAAVSAARDEALAESAERIAGLEREVGEARRRAESDAAALRTAHEAALAEVATAHAAAVADAAARHEAAIAAQARALAEATSRHEVALREKDAALEEVEARHEADVAELRAARGEGAEEQAERQRVADALARASAAEDGIGVLRAELAEERERSQARIAEVEQELVAATSRLEALRRAAEAEGRTARRSPGLWADPGPGDDPDRTRVVGPAPDEGEDLDQTRVLGVVGEEVEETRPFTAKEERDASGERVLPLERGALPRQGGGRGAGAWMAVAALVGFVLVLLVLLGFVG